MKLSQLICIAALGCLPACTFAQASGPPAEMSGASSVTSNTPFSRKEATGLIGEAQKIVSPRGIQQLVPVHINGITQWLSIRGSDARNPILLFIHGGPGDPEMPLAWQFQRSWEDYFTVVQWDQRGAGKTLVANDKKALQETLNLKQMTSDAAEVVRFLKKTYAKKKIFLLGHSWGSVLGVALAQEHPDWFYAYIGVGQVVDIQASEALGYRFAAEQANATHNEVARRELAAIGPYPGPLENLKLESVVTDRKWITYFGGMETGRTNVDYVDKMAILSPDYSEQDVAAISEGSEISEEILIPALLGYDGRSITRINCPVFLFEGRHDWNVPSTLAADWLGHLSAPSKKLVWFENSAHMPMLEEPGQFLVHLVTDVRPLARQAAGAYPVADDGAQ